MTSDSRMSKTEFDSIVEDVRVWGKPGVDGTPLVRRITAEVSLRALAEVSEGRAVQLGRPWAEHPAEDNPRPALHHMVMSGETLYPGDIEPTGYMDFLGVAYHGKVMSHIDAFNHIAYGGQLFGGVDAQTSANATGMDSGDVTLYGPLITRGVLLDMAAFEDVDWVEPGRAWTLDEVKAALQKIGVNLRPGDALLLRSGHDRRRAELGAWNPDEAGAGLHVAAVPWLIEQGVAVFGADGETDVRPSPVEGVTLPIHILTLTMAGIPLLDNLALEEIAHACASRNRYTFALLVAPLLIPRGTGSPVNPVAIF